MRLSLATIVLLASLCACGGPPEEEAVPAAKRLFTFDSGGAWHIEGHGAWLVQVRSDGELWAWQQVRDEARTAYPPARLSPAERDALWTLVDAADLPSVSVEERPGVPDEVEVTFRLQGTDLDPVEVVIWQNDLEKQPALRAIRDALRPLVAEHTGQTPVF